MWVNIDAVVWNYNGKLNISIIDSDDKKDDNSDMDDIAEFIDEYEHRSEYTGWTKGLILKAVLYEMGLLDKLDSNNYIIKNTSNFGVKVTGLYIEDLPDIRMYSISNIEDIGAEYAALIAGGNDNGI